MNYRSLSWNELISYSSKTSYKKRPIIIVELDDDLHRKYNAIVIKHDNNKNVLVRYLDNPFYENKYWWTGNKYGLAGLNPLSYHAKCIGDNFDDMDGLDKNDFQEDGYDDIINYEKESYRFFKSMMEYPYLDGIQGNVHVNNYFISQFNNELLNGAIPECIKKRVHNCINLERKKVPKCKESVLYNLLEGMNDGIIVEEYKKCERGRKKVVEDFKILLGKKMTYDFIKKYYFKIGLSIEEMLSIRDELRNGMININIIKIAPYLLGYNIRIFECNDELNIVDYIYDNESSKWIYLLKHMRNIDTVVRSIN